MPAADSNVSERLNRASTEPYFLCAFLLNWLPDQMQLAHNRDLVGMQSMAHWRLFYHLVWATRERYPYLANAEAARTVERAIEAACRDLRVIVHAVGTMPDHVHLACSIPPSLAIAEVARRLKGSSSHLLNQTAFAEGEAVFAWQAEYGVYSFSERVLPEVVNYVQNQEDRHAATNLWSGFERTESLSDANAPRRSTR